jgi:hypothetical protein
LTGGGHGVSVTYMPPHARPFDAHLVNGPFGDPALYVDLPHAAAPSCSTWATSRP